MKNLKNKNSYVLITPAKNEAAFIEKTIISIINQTILPENWIIVNDGSTDQTEQIFDQYVKKYSFIKLINMPHKEKRDFASKVYAINKGFEVLKNISYNFYGNLDADVCVPTNYYEFVLDKFNQFPKLGVAGGRQYDYYKGSYHKLSYGSDSVAGPIQMFRRSCYEEIGGYTPSKNGLVDAIAEVTARMKGWQTNTFSEMQVHHNRKTGSENRNIFSSTLREGKMDYLFGLHPVFHLGRSLQRIKSYPVFLGSLFRTSSFIFHYIKRTKRPVNDNFVKFLRKEEKKKIKNFIIPDRDTIE